ncbi:hypothetical protein EV294_102674 [Paenibacillus sp. BK033]|uniref:hypothetical protein n=1 Tax=Paenibacillus sp. BK033 TaxID=2512133 RepID=UPI00104D22A7|nr:hypothetical protein [Paenibacillus sp. BK033]TCM99378.1 hypothetical protein EV294_102674 [Paenibacillus sp. BK033]
MDINQYPNFIEAAFELDELSLEGLFGDSTKRLVEHRNLMDQAEYFIKILDDWLLDHDQYGKPNVKALMMLFIKLYLDAIQSNPKIAVEILAAYWRGTRENPELEGISGYTETIRFIQEAKRKMYEIQIKSASERKMSDLKSVMGAFITAYSKSVEYIGQILVPCIQLVKLVNGQEIETVKVMKHTLYEKVDIFNKESNNKYRALTEVLNRDIRNADSHLSIRYIANKQIIEYKKRVGAKINTHNVTPTEWFLSIYPKVGWVIQAFIYSGVLMCIGFSDKPNFIQKYNQIFKNE